MILFDYETLRLIWWVLLGVLLMGFAVMDGFDLGAAILQPFVARNDGERRLVLNSIGPVWEGNQVWLILGGGAIFAAWPMIYAAAFSGFYLAMLLALSALILRPVAIVYRSKMPGARWRAELGRAVLPLRIDSGPGLRGRGRQCAGRRAVPLGRHAAHDI